MLMTDTILIIKETSMTNVLTVLNNFHKNIEFTHEVEDNGKISFLDLLTWKRSTLHSII